MPLRSLCCLVLLGLSPALARAGQDDLPPPRSVPAPQPGTPDLPAPNLVPGQPGMVFRPRSYDGPVMPPRHGTVPPGPMVVMPPGPFARVDGPVYPLRHGAGPVAPSAAYSPYPPAVVYRVSAYQVWQNYGVNMFGEWRPRVIATAEGSWYNGNGQPYYWTATRPGEIMPWGPSGAPAGQ
jgi:hypothetical protein